MRYTLFCLLAVLCLTTSSGCLSRQVAADGTSLRHILVDLYTEQAIDNLIRAYENRPFVQLTYTQVGVNDKDNATAAVTGGEAGFTRDLSSDLTKGAAGAVKKTAFAGKIPLGFSGQRERTLGFQADPVTDRNDIYEDYLAFARNPALFQVSDHDPGCDAHIMRKCGDRWYWVPGYAGNEFLQLVQRASVAPPPSAPAEVFWETGIVSVQPHFNAKGIRVENKFELTLLRPVPNDDGLLRVTLRDSRKRWLTVSAFLEDANAPKAPLVRGTLTLRLLVQFNAKTLPPDEEALLPGATASFLSQNYPNPTPRAAADANQRIIDLLDNIRIQLTRPNGFNP
jgi:hypothetical protein